MIFNLTIASTYALWQFLRSFLHRGWWLVTSVYLVVDTELSPLQLVALGTGQGLVVVLAEIPTGVLADTVSRKWSIVLAHVLMGLAMTCTGLVDSFVAFLLTQMLWGLSWTFSTGADVAWLTDELNQPAKTSLVLTRAAKWGHVGSALGIAVFGGLAWVWSLSSAIVVAGLAMWLLGAWVAIIFPETRFRGRAGSDKLGRAVRILRTGVQTVWLHRTLTVIMACTVLINCADAAFGRLHTQLLVDLRITDFGEPMLLFTLLSIAALALGAISLWFLTHYLSRVGGYSKAYGFSAVTGAVGLLLFALAPTPVIALVGVLVVSGVAMTLLRTVSVIWANENAPSDVRATVQSLLSLSENGGEIVIGFALAIVANQLGISFAMVGGCVLLMFVAWIVRSNRSAD